MSKKDSEENLDTRYPIESKAKNGLTFVASEPELHKTNLYILTSNKKKLKKLLIKPMLSENDVIDAFIYLHLILEAGLNSAFRFLAQEQWLNGVDDLIIAGNIDKVSYIHKTIAFIYFSKFRFADASKAYKYHSIIEKLQDFSYPRNALLHGHSLITVTKIHSKAKRSSKIQGEISNERLQKQLNDFVFIMKGLNFYFNCVQLEAYPGSPARHPKTGYKKFFDYSFIPSRYIDGHDKTSA